MTTRTKPTPRRPDPRPATVSLAQKSLTQWYAEWKAGKTAAPAPAPQPAGETPADALQRFLSS